MRRLADDYQTAEGITFENVTSALEDGARWIQWAETSATSAALEWSANSANTRYNLGQFWALKAEHYAEDPGAWDALDLRGMKAWAALAELGMVKDNPPAQPRYQQEAQQAYAGAIAAAQRIGASTSALERNQVNSGAWFAEAQKSGVDDRMSVAVEGRVNELLDQAGALLGLPLWAWGLGALGVLFLFYGRK